MTATAAPAQFPYAHRTLADVPNATHPSAVVWGGDMLDALRDMRTQGLSYHICAERLGVSYGVVFRKCRQMGWNRRPRHRCNPGHRGW